MKIDLTKLGFSPKEEQIYLALLKFGPSPASVLARHLKLKRTSIYDQLYALLEKNLIISFQQGKITYYTVDDIKKIYFYEKQRTQYARSILGDLERFKSQSPGAQVYYYQGVEGYRELYEDILRTHSSEIMAWVNLDQFYKGLDLKREAEWTKERIQKKIYARLILVDSDLARQFKAEDPHQFRETRLLQDSSFECTNFLYQDNLIFLNPTNGISGIRIHDPVVYQMQKAIFESNWKQINIKT